MYRAYLDFIEVVDDPIDVVFLAAAIVGAGPERRHVRGVEVVPRSPRLQAEVQPRAHLLVPQHLTYGHTSNISP